MPNQPRTPVRSVRVPDELWDRARFIAEDRGITMTAVLNELLAKWVRQNDPHGPGA